MASEINSPLCDGLSIIPRSMFHSMRQFRHYIDLLAEALPISVEIPTDSEYSALIEPIHKPRKNLCQDCKRDDGDDEHYAQSGFCEDCELYREFNVEFKAKSIVFHKCCHCGKTAKCHLSGGRCECKGTKKMFLMPIGAKSRKYNGDVVETKIRRHPELLHFCCMDCYEDFKDAMVRNDDWGYSRKYYYSYYTPSAEQRQKMRKFGAESFYRTTDGGQ